MNPWLLGLGALFLRARDGAPKDLEDSNEEEPASIVPDSILEPTWENVYQKGDSVAWKYGRPMGQLYDNGVDSRYLSYEYVVGDIDHISFVTTSNPSYLNGNVRMDNEAWARLFFTEEEAIAEVNQLEPDEEEEEDGVPQDGPPIGGFGNYTPTFGGGF